MNNKGFLMAEVVVAASIVLVALVGLFTSYNKMYIKYKERRTYFNIDNSYATLYLKDILINEGVLYTNSDNVYNVYRDFSNTKFTSLKSAYNITGAILVKKDSFTNSDGTIYSDVNNAINRETYREYVEYLSKSMDISSEDNYILILERKDSSSSDTYYYGYMVF